MFVTLATIRQWAGALYSAKSKFDVLTIRPNQLTNDQVWCAYTRKGQQSYPMLFGLEYEGYEAHFTLTPYEDGKWDYFHITATAYGQNHIFYRAIRDERTAEWIAQQTTQLVQNDKLKNASEHYPKATKVFSTDVDKDVSLILNALEDKGCCD